MLQSNANPNKDAPEWKNTISAPIYQQVVDWFREKHKIFVTVDYFYIAGYCGKIKHIGNNYFHDHNNVDCARSENYYEAYTKAIEEALKLI